MFVVRLLTGAWDDADTLHASVGPFGDEDAARAWAAGLTIADAKSDTYAAYWELEKLTPPGDSATAVTKAVAAQARWDMSTETPDDEPDSAETALLRRLFAQPRDDPPSRG